MEAQEYLVSFGLTGEFGRFRAAVPLTLSRGERVVVRGHRGIEIARVLREAVPGHAHFLPNTSVGQLLRRATPADEQTEYQMHIEGQQLFERGRLLAVELDLPLELLDVEMLLDGEHALIHHLHWADVDIRPFVSTLSREFELHIALVDLTRDREIAESHGCGRADCGHKEGGGCASCGSCGSAKPQEVQAHFAQLRDKMERQRIALL